MTQSQLAIYYECQNHPGEPVYIIPLLIDLAEGVDCERLERAVAEAIKMLPSFEDPTEFPLVDYRIVDGGKGPKLMLDLHHVICDGTTAGLLIKDIAAAYRGEPLTKPALTMADVEAREEALRNSPRLEEARQWHIDTFGGIEVDSVPLPDRDPRGEGCGRVRSVKMLDVSYQKLFDFSRATGVPLSVVLDGAFGYMLGIWNAATESIFATVFHGRNRPEERDVRGMLVKTLAVHCSWDADTTVAYYLRTLADQRAKARDYSDTYSFGELCADTGVTPRLNFSYRGSIQAEDIHVEGLFVGSRRLGNYSTGDTVQVLVDHVGDCLKLTLEYPEALYTDAYIDSLMATYERVLSQFPDKTKLAEIQLSAPPIPPLKGGQPICPTLLL